MGLSTSFTIAQASLAATAAQSSVVSRNIAGANDPNFSRKIATVNTLYDGTTITTTVSNAVDAALFNNMLGSTSASQYQQALSSGLDLINQTLSTNASSSSDAVTNDQSPSTLISKLNDALQQYAASPSDTNLGQGVVTAARTLASTLNADSTAVQTIRAQADSQIAASVTKVNDLLSQFQAANEAVVTAQNLGHDPTNSLDTRNKILSQLSNEIGISTTTQQDGSLAIYTDSGVTLFDKSPRAVSFNPTTTYVAGLTGSPVIVDGIPVTGSGATMPLQTGKLAGLAVLRDTVTVSYQNQLDQVAQGLVQAFAESDQTGGGAPTAPGLFTYAGAPAMPATPAGLAASIKVNSAADPSQGGQLTRLRDGGIADPANPAYTYNATGAASFSSRLDGLVKALGQTRSFDASTGGLDTGSILAYATSSVSWLQSMRQAASNKASYATALVTSTTQALSNATGVNIDNEMSKMLDVEHSYQASAQLISTINSMYTALFQMAGR